LLATSANLVAGLTETARDATAAIHR